MASEYMEVYDARNVTKPYWFRLNLTEAIPISLVLVRCGR